MKKALATIVIILLFAFRITPAFCSELDIDAQSYILLDAKTGSVLYEYQPDLRCRPASTTKIMTALVALKYGDLNQVMTASNEAVSDIGVGGMNIGVMAGEQMTLNDLLHAMLIASANETANIVSENIFTNKPEFIDKMNSLAKEVGAKNSTFTNPCGIDEYEKDAEHYSTARDLALIAKACLGYQTFRDIVSQPQLNMLSPTNKHEKWNVLNNTNKMLGKTYSYGPDTGDDRNQFTVTGIKTGSTMRAGANFISSAINKDGLEFISVVMGVSNQPGRTVFDFTETLLRAGYENYSNQMIIDRNTKIKTVQVQDAVDDGKLDLVTNGTVESIMPNDKSKWSNIDNTVQIQENLKAPIKKGTVLGNITYKKDGIVIGKVDIVSNRTVEQNLKSKVNAYTKSVVSSNGFKIATVVVSIIVGFLILRFTLRRISRRRKYLRRRY